LYKKHFFLKIIFFIHFLGTYFGFFYHIDYEQEVLMQNKQNSLPEFRKHPVIRQLFLLIRKGDWNNRKQRDRLTSLEGQMIRQLEELQLLRKEFKTTVRIGLIIMLSALSGISAPDLCGECNSGRYSGSSA
jgi:hypothetical protein